MESITDIPLYDIIQEIETKHGADIHMRIEAFADDDNLHGDNETTIDLEKIYWWCEFQDQVKVFDNIAAVRHWFLNEVEVDYKKGKVVVEY